MWDNNVLGESHWRDLFAELKELKVEVDFNQGLDARLVTEEVAEALVGGYVSATYASASGFVILLLVLFTRPTGLFKTVAVERV